MHSFLTIPTVLQQLKLANIKKGNNTSIRLCRTSGISWHQITTRSFVCTRAYATIFITFMMQWQCIQNLLHKKFPYAHKSPEKYLFCMEMSFSFPLHDVIVLCFDSRSPNTLQKLKNYFWAIPTPCPRWLKCCRNQWRCGFDSFNNTISKEKILSTCRRPVLYPWNWLLCLKW